MTYQEIFKIEKLKLKRERYYTILLLYFLYSEFNYIFGAHMIFNNTDSNIHATSDLLYYNNFNGIGILSLFMSIFTVLYTSGDLKKEIFNQNIVYGLKKIEILSSKLLWLTLLILFFYIIDLPRSVLTYELTAYFNEVETTGFTESFKLWSIPLSFIILFLNISLAYLVSILIKNITASIVVVVIGFRLIESSLEKVMNIFNVKISPYLPINMFDSHDFINGDISIERYILATCYIVTFIFGGLLLFKKMNQ